MCIPLFGRIKAEVISDFKPVYLCTSKNLLKTTIYVYALKHVTNNIVKKYLVDFWEVTG